MIEENIIREHDSGRRPFQVPEGYFDGFNDRLMQRLHEERLLAIPAKEVGARQVVLPLYRRVLHYAAAAVLAGVCLISAALLYTNTRHSDVATQMAELEFSMTDDEVDAVLDSEMMNNSEIAYYLTEAY